MSYVGEELLPSLTVQSMGPLLPNVPTHQPTTPAPHQGHPRHHQMVAEVDMAGWQSTPPGDRHFVGPIRIQPTQATR